MKSRGAGFDQSTQLEVCGAPTQHVGGGQPHSDMILITYIYYIHIYTWYTHISYIRVDIIHMMKYIDMRACIIYITFTFAFTFAFAFTCTFAFTFPFAFRLTRTFTCAFTFACTCTFAFTFALTFALHSNYITYMLQGIRRGPTRNAMIRTVRHRMVR